MNDYIDKKYNKLTVKEFIRKNASQTFWRCQCDCGTIKVYQLSNLKNNSTKSCG